MRTPLTDSHPFSRRFMDLGVLFVSASSLGFEIALTRFFSVAKGYHFAYLVISIALLGYGAAGTFLRLFPDLVSKNLNRLLVTASALYSVSILLSYLGVNRIPFEMEILAWDPGMILYLVCDLILLSVPFFFAGMIVAACLYNRHPHSGRIYFFDLTGGAIGCFIPLVFFSFSFGESVLWVLMICSLLALLCFSFPTGSSWRFISIPAIVICVIMIIMQPRFFETQMSPYRDVEIALRYEQAEIKQTHWNAISKIDVIDSPAVRFAPGLSLLYPDSLPEQLGMAIDGGQLQALTAIEPERMRFIEYLPSSLAYELVQKPDSVFIYDFGGGLDILTGLYWQAGRIDATERNPGVVSVFTNYLNFPTREKIHEP